mgnify:CR=1 FL=1
MNTKLTDVFILNFNGQPVWKVIVDGLVIPAEFNTKGAALAAIDVERRRRKNIKEKEMTTEFVKFRLIRMPCCGTQICWVNPRLPNYCPECSAEILAQLRLSPECILFTDEEARLLYSTTHESMP